MLLITQYKSDAFDSNSRSFKTNFHAFKLPWDFSDNIAVKRSTLGRRTGNNSSSTMTTREEIVSASLRYLLSFKSSDVVHHE